MNTLSIICTFFKRNLKKEFSEPIWVFMGLMEPVLYITLYMPLLKNLRLGHLPSEDIIRSFVPGILALMTMGGLFSGFAFIDEIRQGIIDRWLISPIKKSSIMYGILLSKALIGFVQITILMIVATLYGLEISLIAALATFLLIMIALVATISLSHAISIRVKDEGVLAGITRTIYLPLMLLSGIMIPIDLAPNWMKIVSSFNPFFYVVETGRKLFADDFSNPMVIKGFCVVIFFAIFSTWFAIRSLKKEVA